MEKTVYFIEDLDTGLWYRNVLLMKLPSVHTFGKGWDCPDPLPDEYWTNDPEQAFNLKHPTEMIDFMNKGLKRVGNRGQFTNWVNFSNGSGRAKQLVVTEHIFIDIVDFNEHKRTSCG